MPCDLCGSQPNLRRRRVKELLAELSREHPAVKGNLLNALGKVVPTHLLDRRLLARLGEGRGPDPWMDGDADEACPGEGGDPPVTLGGVAPRSLTAVHACAKPERCAQPVMRFSRIAISQYMTMPSTASAMSPAKMSGTWNCACACSIRLPMP